MRTMQSISGEPINSSVCHAAFRIVVLASLIALLLALRLVPPTHAPVVGGTAAISVLSTTDEIAAPGHAHGIKFTVL